MPSINWVSLAIGLVLGFLLAGFLARRRAAA